MASQESRSVDLRTRIDCVCVVPRFLPKLQHSVPFVVCKIAPVLTTSVKEPAEDDGSSHSGMASPDRGLFPK